MKKMAIVKERVMKNEYKNAVRDLCYKIAQMEFGESFVVLPKTVKLKRKSTIHCAVFAKVSHRRYKQVGGIKMTFYNTISPLDVFTSHVNYSVCLLT